MTDAVGASDIDALMDRGDIGRAGERPDDAAGAEDRQPAEDAQARVHGLQRQLGAALHADGDLEAAGVAPFGGELGEVAFDHLSRHRIDRRLADRQGQPRAGHRTDPGAGMEAHARLGAQAHPGEHQGAVGDVGIVAGILEVPASAPFSQARQNSRRISTCWPLGRTICTASLIVPPSSRRAAARLVAVAQLPVV